jgi:SH3-like domain-containing protein
MKFLVSLLAIMLLAAPVLAAENDPPGRTGLPLPRFVSTRSDAVNVRSGPGERYPVQWVLRKQGMPVEVVAEYENWRKIRDWEGTEGWVNQALLSGKRGAVIYPSDGVLREKPDAISPPIARLQKGVMVRVNKCTSDWCDVLVGKTDGWISKTALWGIYPNETIE